MLNIKTIQATLYQTNNYLVELDTGYILIEASADVEKIKQQIGDKKLLAVIITHSHFDHVKNLENVIKCFGVNCYMHPVCKNNIVCHKKEFYGDMPFCVNDCEQNFIFIDDNEIVDIGEKQVQFFYAPGHTNDGIVAKIDECLFVGDTLFFDGMGRTDLPGGNYQEIIKSIKKILTFPNEFVIYPGHGQKTCVAHEKINWEGENEF